MFSIMQCCHFTTYHKFITYLVNSFLPELFSFLDPKGLEWQKCSKLWTVMLFWCPVGGSLEHMDFNSYGFTNKHRRRNMASLYVFLCFEKLLIWENMPINIQQSIFEVDQKISSKLSKNKNAFSFFGQLWWKVLIHFKCWLCVCVCGGGGA